MTGAEYIKNRVDDQISWFSSKSTKLKKKYFISEIINIVIAAIMSASAKLSISNVFISNLISVLSITLVILNGLKNLFKWNELWVQYRTTAEMLKREKLLYLTNSGVYRTNEDAFNLFVERIESILDTENSSWIKLSSSTV